jgi:hypothetical protein
LQDAVSHLAQFAVEEVIAVEEGEHGRAAEAFGAPRASSIAKTTRLTAKAKRDF